MNKRGVAAFLATVLVMMIAGCMGQPNAAEQSMEYSPKESPVVESVDKNGVDALKPTDDVSETEEKPVLETDAPASEAEKISIVVGDDVKLETSLEHITATSGGKEYTID